MIFIALMVFQGPTISGLQGQTISFAMSALACWHMPCNLGSSPQTILAQTLKPLWLKTCWLTVYIGPNLFRLMHCRLLFQLSLCEHHCFSYACRCFYRHVGAKSTHADARMECRMEHVSRSRADAALLVVSCVLIAFFWKAAAVLFCVCTTRLADFVVIAFWLRARAIQQSRFIYESNPNPNTCAMQHLYRVQHLHAYCAARVPHLFLKSGFKTCTRTSFIFEIVFQQTVKTRTRLHACL